METLDPMITAEQLLHMSCLGKRFELVRGGLVSMEPTGGRHGQVTARVAWPLEGYVRRNRCGTAFAGEPGFHLERDPDTVLAPNVAYVSAGRLRPQDVPDNYPELAPDIVVEVLSPRDRWIELGARIVWVVAPAARTITVHEAGLTPRVLTENDRLTAASVLPEFACPVAEIFES